MDIKITADQAALAAREAVQQLLDEVKEDIRSRAALDWPAGRLALTLDEAAAALGIPPSTLADQLRAGRIKGTKVGRHWLLTRRQLLDALEQSSQ